MAAVSLSPATGVVVTGGASGIGRACAQTLSEAGRPVAVWDRDGAGAEAVAKQVAADTGVDTIGIGIDVTDSSAFADAIDRTRAALGSIGGLVHSAGAVRSDNIGALDETGWDFVLNVNLRAEALLVQALLEDLRAAEGAAVVGIASIEAVVGNAAIPAYCASKAGLLGLTRSMALQLASDGIRVNAVCPGFIDTPMLGAAGEGRKRMAAECPLKRLGEPRDIAKAVRFLLSDEASFVTGTHLVVDGGSTVSDLAPTG
jgi:NAD(P)-dependent dehydrogenase (short-subunit alcohol dehydrogenase family)